MVSASLVAPARALGAALLTLVLGASTPVGPPAAAPKCAADNGGLTLAKGLCASVFATGIGPVRHIAVAPNGDIFAAVYGPNGGVAALRDTDGDGVADLVKRFGPKAGSGITLADGWLYFATDDQVVRWKMAPGQLEPTGQAEVIVKELPTGGHTAKSVAVRGDELFVNIGSRTNSCQQKDRNEKSPGIDPCVELETRAGVWRFSASRPNQTQKDGVRYATGLRNTVALAVQPGSSLLFGAPHGRDQLAQNWGFSTEKSAENPGEEFVQIQERDDFGWPYCYYDVDLKTLVTAPEYGGDGKKTDRCTKAKAPVSAFPGHWAPMGIAFAKPGALGAPFGEGAFLAFHGSWNRAPLPQSGYRVVFQPLKGTSAAGAHVLVAIGQGDSTSVRPVGLAVAADGSLYISADKNGKIWKVVKAG